MNKNRFQTPFSPVMRWTLHSDFQLSQMVLFSRKCIADAVFTFSHSSTWKAGVLTLFVAFVDSEDALVRRWMCFCLPGRSTYSRTALQKSRRTPITDLSTPKSFRTSRWVQDEDVKPRLSLRSSVTDLCNIMNNSSCLICILFIHS